MIETSLTKALSRFLDVDVARHKLITTNLANIDTPGYRTRDLNFHAELARASGEAAGPESGGLHYASFAPVARPTSSSPISWRSGIGRFGVRPSQSSTPA